MSRGILVHATQILLLAPGETFIIIAARIDLSIGYTLELSAVVGAEAVHEMGVIPKALNNT